eukprot:CAMPEP_0196811236 /NCGR_PEP_ID=MMETSP1362-20130617/17027_1 /TAXON_ID=163516 /ORGANISM="Leptocylindrus danicus, Strain CCMP1856" /LENGTH=400 /DNA_ID=CAMNT_0042186505 /DNA_START=34 /DNA_END=1236 /DNA_ORIENTATION=-
MMNPITKELEWNCSTLPSIPDFTPLATTHASIRSSTSANDITRRLCECFAKRSLVTEELNADEARAVVRCTRDAHTTKIAVQLYQKNESKTTAVIVEVVRLSGDMLLFRRESQAILSAARGDNELNKKKKKEEEKKKNPCMSSTKRPVLSRPVPVKKRSRSGGTTSQGDHDVHMHMAIEKTDELIKKDRMDACIIGWASLCALTDSSTDGGHGTAVHASKIVLGLDEEMTTDIHMNVFEILSSRCCENTRSDIDEVHTSHKTSIEIEIALRIRRLAFQALKNALHTLYSTGNVHLLQAQDFKHDLIMLLVEEMKFADVSPCEASMAAACLKVLFLLLQQNDRDSHNEDGAIQSEAQEVLIQAKYTGGCSYADLAIASERALAALNARNNDVNDVVDVASQ